jgi:hypothetical protein
MLRRIYIWTALLALFCGANRSFAQNQDLQFPPPDTNPIAVERFEQPQPREAAAQCVSSIGWFFTLEADLSKPHVSNIDFFVDGVKPQVPSLDWTVIPNLTLGYRWEQGNALLVNYRYLASEGQSSAAADPVFGPESIRNRLDSNWIDLTYLFREHGPWYGFRLQWEVGVRMAYLFYDLKTSMPTSIEQESESFFGAGPHGGMNLSWSVGSTGLAIFGRLDLAVLIGRTDDTTTGVFFAAPGIVAPIAGVPNSTSSTAGGTKALLDSRFEIGLSWTVPNRPWLRFAGGYQNQGFVWNGHDISEQGPFLRCELGF